MKKDIKERWIKALLSGEYFQAQGCLKYGDGYCCLGVLCDLYLIEKGGQWEIDKGTFHIDDEDSLLPKKVADWAGVGHRSPSADGVALAVHNDNGNKTFEQIAELIKKYF